MNIVRILEKLPVHDDVFGGFFEILMGFSEGGIFGDPSLKRLSTLVHMEDSLLTSITGDCCSVIGQITSQSQGPRTESTFIPATTT